MQAARNVYEVYPIGYQIWWGCAGQGPISKYMYIRYLHIVFISNRISRILSAWNLQVELVRQVCTGRIPLYTIVDLQNKGWHQTVTEVLDRHDMVHENYLLLKILRIRQIWLGLMY